jgi:hypothetical protein
MAIIVATGSAPYVLSATVKPSGVLDEDQLERVAVDVDDLAPAEGRCDGAQGRLGEVGAEVGAEDGAGHRRGGGRVDHRGQAALAQREGADLLGRAEADREVAGVDGVQEAVVGGRGRAGLRRPRTARRPR